VRLACFVEHIVASLARAIHKNMGNISAAAI
jgi:hypothetical protein